MAFRLSDVSVQGRLYTLLIASTVGVVAILVLAAYVMLTYRINGPIYEEISAYQRVESAIQPPVMYEVYITLQEMETQSAADEIRESKARFEKLVAEYEKSRAAWLRVLPSGSDARRHEAERHAHAARLIGVARGKYLPKIEAKGPRDAASQVLRDEVIPTFRDLRRASDSMTRALEEESEQLETQSSASIRFWMRLLVILSLATLLIGGLV